MLKRVRERKAGERDPEKLAFLTAAEESLSGVSEWIRRYSEFLTGDLARIAAKVATEPPSTFHEAMQLIWFAHQAIHIEGHGWSCAPDHIDRLLLPYYEADKKAGRLNDAQALALCENFVLKMLDNTYWGPLELTQGLCVGGSTPDGQDLTNRLSWLFIEGGTNLALPEPLLWIRWHPRIDQEFFDFCLARLAQHTCFPLMWNDKVVPAGFMELGVSREDAYNYIAVGCNELAIPGQCYFNPGASANYLRSIELALTSGKGYRGGGKNPLAPPAAELATFESFAAAVGAYLRDGIEKSYRADMLVLKATDGMGPHAVHLLLLRRLHRARARHGAGHQVQHPLLRRRVLRQRGGLPGGHPRSGVPAARRRRSKKWPPRARRISRVTSGCGPSCWPRPSTATTIRAWTTSSPWSSACATSR